MFDASSPRQGRDDDLTNSFADRARFLIHDYKDWILLEIKDCMPKAEALEATLPEGDRKNDVSFAIQRMSTIEKYDLPEAVKNLRQKCTEIDDSSYSDVMDAHQWIEDGLSRFEGMVRGLLSIRELLDSLWEPDN
jgi:hypothetical protein